MMVDQHSQKDNYSTTTNTKIMNTKHFWQENSFIMLLLLIICSLLGITDPSLCAAEIIATPGGGVVETGGTNTTQFSRENSEDLLLNEIERKVVKIRPMGNPLEQISRFCTRRPSKSQIVEYYSTDTIPADAKLKAAYTEPTDQGEDQIVIDTTNNKIFSQYETIIFPEIKGYDENGTTQTEVFLILYILRKSNDGKLIVMPVNGKAIGAVANAVPTLPANTKIIRSGRAHNEVDMKTTTYACVPTKRKQYLQIFRAQIEQSTLQKIADKETDWEFSDLEEEALFDMRRGMNKSFWLGVPRIIQDADTKDIFLTGGIWWQAGRTFAYGTSPTDLQFTKEMLVDLSQVSFTGNAGNKTKIFIVGSGLMSNLSKITYDKVVNDEKIFVRYGIRFKEIVSNFGTLWLVLDESLDEMGMADKGLVFDADYLRKYAIYTLKVRDLDLRASGDKDVDARTISEISGLVLQNPEAHVKVIPLK